MRFKVANYSRLEIRLDTLHIYTMTLASFSKIASCHLHSNYTSMVTTNAVSLTWSARSRDQLLARLAAVLAEARFIEAVKVAVALDVRAARERLLASVVVLARDTRVVITERTVCTVRIIRSKFFQCTVGMEGHLTWKNRAPAVTASHYDSFIHHHQHHHHH